VKNLTAESPIAAIIATAYAQLLYLLVEKNQFDEKDYFELVDSAWGIDGERLTGHDFNTKWKYFCLGLDVEPELDEEGNLEFSDANVSLIASKLYQNRYMFQMSAGLRNVNKLRHRPES
jgi:hypothetical protein